MPGKSFYDLDYIIEINEKRVESNISAYHKVLDRLTVIILVYSAMAIYLVPIIQDIFFESVGNWFLYVSFATFSLLFIISVIFTIKLIIPVTVAYLTAPKIYYGEYRIGYEEDIKIQDKIEKQTHIDALLKASYINELETAVLNNKEVFRNKSSFFYRAIIFALLSAIPYVVCLGFHLSKREDKPQKVLIINPEISGKLHKIDSMSDSKPKDTSSTSTTTATETTRLPGVNAAEVRASSPDMIKENSSHIRTKEAKK